MIGLIRFILFMSMLLFFGGTGWLYLKDRASVARYAAGEAMPVAEAENRTPSLGRTADRAGPREHVDTPAGKQERSDPSPPVSGAADKPGASDGGAVDAVRVAPDGQGAVVGRASRGKPGELGKPKRVLTVRGDAAATAPRRRDAAGGSEPDIRAQPGPSGAMTGPAADAPVGPRQRWPDQGAAKADARTAVDEYQVRSGPAGITGSVAASRAAKRRRVEQAVAAQPHEPGADAQARRMSRQRAAAEARPVPGRQGTSDQAPAGVARSDPRGQAKSLRDIIGTFNGRAVREPDRSRRPDVPKSGRPDERTDRPDDDRRAVARPGVAPAPEPQERSATLRTRLRPRTGPDARPAEPVPVPPVRSGRAAAHSEVPAANAIKPQRAKRRVRAHRMSPGRHHHYVVRQGDTLWTIAHRLYGRGSRYTRIFEANRQRIHDPNLIFPKQRFQLPRSR